MKSSIFICEHKTGTVRINRVLSNFAKPLKHLNVCTPKNLIIREHTPKEIFAGLFHKIFKIKNNFFYIYNRADVSIKDKDVPIFVLIRDPRDMCISAAKYDGDIENEDKKDSYFLRYSKETEGMTIQEKILHQSVNDTYDTLNRIYVFLESHKDYDITILKYEDYDDLDNTVNTISDKINLDGFEKVLFKSTLMQQKINHQINNNHIKDGTVSQYKKYDNDLVKEITQNLSFFIKYFGYPV